MKTPDERAKHWRDEATRICAAFKGNEDDELDEQDRLEITSVLLKACRYTLRVPEGTNIIDFLREYEANNFHTPPDKI